MTTGPLHLSLKHPPIHGVEIDSAEVNVSGAVAPRGMNAKAASAYCGISVSQLRRYGPPPIKIGSRSVWLRDTLDSWIDGLATVASHTRKKSAEAEWLEA